MNRFLPTVLLISHLLAYSPYSGYNFLTSQNFLTAQQSAYNFNIYSEAQYNFHVSFTDSSHAADGQFHQGNSAYYLINFDHGPFKLHHILVKAVAGVNAFIVNYRLQGSLDGNNFFDINNGAVYPGLRTAQDAVTFYFSNVIWVTQLRFIPIDYFGLLSFDLTVFYDDEAMQQVGAPITKAVINNFALPGDPIVKTTLPPFNYVNYNNDRFNGVSYYASAEGLADRPSNNAIVGHNYNDTPGNTPFDAIGATLLAQILNHFFDDILLKDPVLGPAFLPLDPTQHKHLVYDFFAKMLGGPDNYTGKTMNSAHTGLGIPDSEYDRFISLITQAFNDFNVNAALVVEVIRRLETYRNEVIKQ